MTKRYKYEEWGMTDEDGSPKKFRRNKIDGRLGGVCSGIGDYISVDATLIRIAFVISLFMTGFITFWIYLGLWIFVPKDHRAPYRRERYEEIEARRENPTQPERTRNFRDVKSKYRSLEKRLADLERSITSSEWQLRRDFRDLES